MGRVFAHALRVVRRSAVVLPVASGLFYYLVLLSSSSFVAESRNVPSCAGRRGRWRRSWAARPTSCVRPGGWRRGWCIPSRSPC